jgi:hypothetical protein
MASKKKAGKKVKDLAVKRAQAKGVKGGVPKLLQAAAKGKVFSKVEIHGV